jgi:hypothetical protein
VSCRLLVCIPAALLEDLWPSDSLSRSWALTRDEAGPAFLVLFLYFVLFLVASSIFQFPFSLMQGFSQAGGSSSAALWAELRKVGQFVATVLVTPYLTIATVLQHACEEGSVRSANDDESGSNDCALRTQRAADTRVTFGFAIPPARTAPNQN